MSDGHVKYVGWTQIVILILKKRASYVVDKNVVIGIRGVLVDTLWRTIIVLAYRAFPGKTFTFVYYVGWTNKNLYSKIIQIWVDHYVFFTSNWRDILYNRILIKNMTFVTKNRAGSLENTCPSDIIKIWYSFMFTPFKGVWR